ncbi:nucleoside-diphosphate kinase [Fervidicoccus fontis]|jgi:nucleoside-diphosphate kinase|uniref:Nucleoside diphosphate kinase n=2 Tax=Fervidicoccus fontis TaxID=683846 RepID=I0A0D1_FERFK|nr:nucleoside-diphosphate kinase [Fervidicoccus fontis]AFH42438.1 nucleoside diphosphate kinase [Fervidicoccus fontis Kam940]MBE9391052.1 nucleoside-diphosphate kinase [Fervidicoccus fontis]PMB76066.1 MAG: nucleoside-diphosphate kinase [Fervidicoccus fontis]HEW63538.1 nucleoside-diphosphate kinase [Fervidicoccus fontis]
MAIERTFVMIKPDAVERKLIGEIISRFERKNLKIVAMKLIKMTKEQAKELYIPHKDKPFYNDLVNFATRGPVVVMVLEGDSAVEVVRTLIGSTDGRKALPGTIRGDFALDIQENVIHASDSKESYEREHKIFFLESELLKY